MGIKYKFGDIGEINLHSPKPCGNRYAVISLAVSHDKKVSISEHYPSISSYLRLGSSIMDALVGDSPLRTADFIRIEKLLSNIEQVKDFIDGLPDPDLSQVVERLAQFK